MAFSLVINRPRMDNRDCIRGWEIVALPEYGSFETEAYANALAARLEKEWRFDLGDGEAIQVWKDGKPQPQFRVTFVTEDSECPF